MKFFKINQNHKPIIHFITNYVTVNDLANVTAILNSSPIMADEPSEMEDIAAFADCLVINIGTVNQQQFESIKIACKIANQRNIPIILDPVGVACSKFRQTVVKYILDYFYVAIIKGNQSEINYLITGTQANSGIDTAKGIEVLDSSVIKHFCEKYHTIIIATGESDYVVDTNHVTVLSNGTSIAANLIGTGCMLGAVLGVYASICKADYYHASIQAISHFNIAIEIAATELGTTKHIGSFKTLLWDAIGDVDEQTITKYLKIK